MKFIFLLVFVLMASIASAKNICPVNTKIPEDVRLTEAHYSKKNASKAIDFLNGVVKQDKSAGEWINVPNALKTIDGYIRKRECIEHGDAIGGWKCSEFCSFMESSFVYD